MNHNELTALLRLSDEDTYQDALRLSVELGVQTVDADEGSLLVLDVATQELVFAMTVGDTKSESVLVGQRVPMGKGLTGLAALTGEVQVGVPSYTSVQQAGHRDYSGPRYLIAAPMFAHDRLVGVLTAASFRHERQFSSDDVRLFGRVAALAGIVITKGQREKVQADIRDGSASGDGSEAGALQQQVAESIGRLTRGEPARLRAVLEILVRLEILAQ